MKVEAHKSYTELSYLKDSIEGCDVRNQIKKFKDELPSNFNDYVVLSVYADDYRMINADPKLIEEVTGDFDFDPYNYDKQGRIGYDYGPIKKFDYSMSYGVVKVNGVSCVVATLNATEGQFTGDDNGTTFYLEIYLLIPANKALEVIKNPSKLDSKYSSFIKYIESKSDSGKSFSKQSQLSAKQFAAIKSQCTTKEQRRAFNQLVKSFSSKIKLTKDADNFYLAQIIGSTDDADANAKKYFDRLSRNTQEDIIDFLNYMAFTNEPEVAELVSDPGFGSKYAWVTVSDLISSEPYNVRTEKDGGLDVNFIEFEDTSIRFVEVIDDRKGNHIYTTETIWGGL